MIISSIVIGLFLPHSVTDILAQSPQSSIKDQNIVSLNANDAIFNANTTEFLGIKNMSLTPYLVTEGHYIDHGILKNVGNVTNNKTFTNTYLSDELLVGRGKGTIETTDGQSIDWISSDLGRPSDNQWVFHGVMLFNNTQGESLSFLNNRIGLYNSTSDVNDPEVHLAIGIVSPFSHFYSYRINRLTFLTLCTKVRYIPKCVGSKIVSHFLHVYTTVKGIFRK